jgi:cephalosporin hydroxylase
VKIKIVEHGREREVDIYSKEGLLLISELWTKVSCHNRLMYEPAWLGIPIIQFPEDIVIMQELIWKIRPDVIVETGVAHGGSAILYSSILEIIGKGKVIAVDIEIRQYNKVAIKSHPLSKRINLIEGSSTDANIFKEIKSLINKGDKVLVTLDSNHSYEHVLKELEMYSRIVPEDSYLVAMDGAQAFAWDIPAGKMEWKEDNPLKAIEDFLSNNPDWESDSYYNRLVVTSNPMGFLRRKQENKK